MREHVKNVLEKVFKGLMLAGFQLPLHLVVTGADRGFMGLRVEQDYSVREEFSSERGPASFPVDIEVFERIRQTPQDNACR